MGQAEHFTIAVTLKDVPCCYWGYLEVPGAKQEMINDRNKADELETLLRLMLDAPPVKASATADPVNGLTIEQIRESTGWADQLVHRRLIDLGNKVGNAKLRVNKEKAAYYFLKAR